MSRSALTCESVACGLKYCTEAALDLAAREYDQVFASGNIFYCCDLNR